MEARQRRDRRGALAMQIRYTYAWPQDVEAATRAIHERWPEVKVVALTSLQEEDLVHLVD